MSRKEVTEVWFVIDPSAENGAKQDLYLFDVEFFQTKLDAERYARHIYSHRKDIRPDGMVYYRKVYSFPEAN